jgi:hypothetical protein
MNLFLGSLCSIDSNNKAHHIVVHHENDGPELNAANNDLCK